MERQLIGRFWLCQNCGKHVPARLQECRCGFSSAGAAEIGLERVGGGAPHASVGPAWFAISTAKLAIMCTVTLGLYQVYWFYRQWRSVRDSGEDIRPLPRSIFGVIFGYSLFRRVVDSARDLDAPGVSAGVLAVVHILLCLSSRLPLPFGMLAVLSVWPLVAVQRVANAVALRDFPDEDPDSRYTAANWVGIALGGAFLVLLGYALVVRQQATSLEALSRIAAEANQTPHAAKDGIQLERVEPQEGMLIYHFTVTTEARARLEERAPLLKPLMARSVCRDRLMVLGVSVRFVYTDPSGETVSTVDISPRDCS